MNRCAGGPFADAQPLQLGRQCLLVRLHRCCSTVAFLLPTMATAHASIILQACKATTLDAVVVATDDERIAEVCRAAGAQVVMTFPDCPNGA